MRFSPECCCDECIGVSCAGRDSIFFRLPDDNGEREIELPLSSGPPYIYEGLLEDYDRTSIGVVKDLTIHVTIPADDCGDVIVRVTWPVIVFGVPSTTTYRAVILAVVSPIDCSGLIDTDTTGINIDYYSGANTPDITLREWAVSET